MARRQIITSDKLQPAREDYSYSHAVRVGNTIYIAGQVARDKDYKIVHKRDFLGQVRHAFESMKNVLEAAGASMQDVVKLTFYCTNLHDLVNINEVYEEYFGEHIPAMTAVEVVRLWNPHFLVEVEAVAVVGEEQIIIDGKKLEGKEYFRRLPK